MKLSNEQAAFLYLLIFNIDEGPGRDPDDPEDKMQKLADQAEHLLHDSEYPTDVVTDNEGMAMINWPDGFDQEKWFNSLTHIDPEGWYETTPLGVLLSLLLDYNPLFTLEEILPKVDLLQPIPYGYTKGGDAGLMPGDEGYDGPPEAGEDYIGNPGASYGPRKK